MSTFVISIICGVMFALMIYSFVEMFKAKNDLKKEQKEFQKEQEKLQGRLDEQTKIINGMETGDNVTDFNNSLDVLHQYAKKGRSKT